MPPRSSAPSTPTSSRTPAPTPTWPSTRRCSSQGATVLAMRLDHGGHLTHGCPASIVSKFWRFVSYGVTPESRRRRQPRRGHRLRPGGAPGQDGEAGAHRRRLHRLLPDHRPVALPRDRRLGRRLLHVRRRPPGGADRRRRAPQPGRCGRRRDAHHAQDAPRPPRRRHPLRGGPGQEDRQRRLPRPPGRSARARHRGQGGRLRRGGPAGVPRSTRRRWSRTRSALASALAGQGFRLVSGGTDNHMLLVDLRPFDADLTGKEAQEVLDRRRHHFNRNTIPDDPRCPSSPRGCAWAPRPRPPPAWARPRWW